MVKMAVP